MKYQLLLMTALMGAHELNHQIRIMFEFFKSIFWHVEVGHRPYGLIYQIFAFHVVSKNGHFGSVAPKVTISHIIFILPTIRLWQFFYYNLNKVVIDTIFVTQSK